MCFCVQARGAIPIATRGHCRKATEGWIVFRSFKRRGWIVLVLVLVLFHHQHIVHHIHLLGQGDNNALLVLIELNLSTTDKLGN